MSAAADPRYRIDEDAAIAVIRVVPRGLSPPLFRGGVYLILGPVSVRLESGGICFGKIRFERSAGDVSQIL